MLSDKGLSVSDEILYRVNTAGDPEWTEGRSFDESVELCERMCLGNSTCAGVMLSPEGWYHQECFGMKEGDIYFFISGMTAQV